MNGPEDTSNLEAEIAQLKAKLEVAEAALRRKDDNSRDEITVGQISRQMALEETINGDTTHTTLVTNPISSSLHNLMLLSDSALPLGSFAYSSGLESFLSHHKPLPLGTSAVSLFHKFLSLSIQSIAYTNLPYALGGYRHPDTLLDLDNDLDASTPCTVARRASIAQGRALLSVWEKAFASAANDRSSKPVTQATTSLREFSREMKMNLISQTKQPSLTSNGHLAPLWGCVCLALGLSIEETGYLFLLNHAKAIVSAAIRASVLGPYMAQSILAGRNLQDLVQMGLDRVWNVLPKDAGQVVPVMDLWVGRHELLYSRIFNS